jgi:hypothetical protein
MPDTTTELPSRPAAGRPGDDAPAGAWRRLGWFAAIWCGSLAAWLAFAYGLRWVMQQVGIAG